MKRAFLAAALTAAFVFASCVSGDWGDTVMTNSSGESVTFKFRHTDEITLASGASRSVSSAAYQQIEYWKPEKRVKFIPDFNSANPTGRFEPRTAHTVNFTNNLTVEVKVSAGGWMDGEPVTVAATPPGTASGTIYLNDSDANPVFAVTVNGGGYARVEITSRTGSASGYTFNVRIY